RLAVLRNDRPTRARGPASGSRADRRCADGHARRGVLKPTTMAASDSSLPRRGRPPNPQLRERVLTAALDLFADRGYDATSVNEVVLRAGVTKGALYHYFTAKEDLLYEIYRGLLDQQLTDLDRILAERTDPAAALHAVIENLVTTTISHAREVTVFSRETSRLGEERW